MPCLALTVLLSLLVLAVLAIHQYRRKRLTVRWWGAALLAVFTLASFPLTIITTAYFLIQSHFLAPDDLGLWITGAWQDYGRYASLAWVVGFPLVIKLKGVEFASPRHAGWSIGIAIAIMLPLTVADAAVFWVDTQTGQRTEISAVSPDGAWLATAVRTGNPAVCRYTLVSEENVRRPWLSRTLASVTIGTPEELAALGPPEAPGAQPSLDMDRLAWSRDGQIVALWRGGQVMIVYDFSRGGALTLSDPAWVQEGETGEAERPGRWRRFREAAERLMQEHGGAAE
jgi:hypothetical protein